MKKFRLSSQRGPFPRWAPCGEKNALSAPSRAFSPWCSTRHTRHCRQCQTRHPARRAPQGWLAAPAQGVQWERPERMIRACQPCHETLLDRPAASLQHAGAQCLVTLPCLPPFAHLPAPCPTHNARVDTLSPSTPPHTSRGCLLGIAAFIVASALARDAGCTRSGTASMIASGLGRLDSTWRTCTRLRSVGRKQGVGNCSGKPMHKLRDSLNDRIRAGKA